MLLSHAGRCARRLFSSAARLNLKGRGHGHLEILGATYHRDQFTNVTPEIISKVPRRLHDQTGHPLCTLRKLIESHFPTFTRHVAESPVVSPFKNFDELGFPPEHPGRSVTDSYYINKGLMLRTHTSAHEIEVFSSGTSQWLLTADVYRRDEIDASHYPVFHQMEGARTFPATESSMKELAAENQALEKQLAASNIVIQDIENVSPTNPRQVGHDLQHTTLVAQNLKLCLNGLLLRMFGRSSTKENPLQVRWIEAYFPFTSPSFEVEVFFKGKWLEILGSGIIQQTTLHSSGIQDRIGWAFGLGLERIAMILYSIPDIRLFWSTDSRFLSQFKDESLQTFKPYSKYPPCFKDVSFWTQEGQGLHDNDFCDLIRDVAGDLVEDVKQIDSFVHPRTKRTSLCYRINYRSMDRSLSNEEVNEIQSQVVGRLKDHFGVVIR